MHSSRTTHTSLQRQRGAAFIVMLVILVVGVAAFLVSALSKVSLHTEQQRQSSDMLAQVKEIVVGYALNNTASSQYPGELLYPDVLSETPPNYDGNTEGGCLNAAQANGLPPISSGANMRCLGRLPWKVFNMPIASPSENDPTGFMPWYAISANMVDTGTTPFNSELLNSAPHPWLTVRDMKGNILSPRVALIIFIPGAALPGQSRPLSTAQGGPGLGGANQYLDSITVPATCAAPCVPGTYSNADMDDDFIMGDEHRWIDDPANPGKQIEDPTYHFNDKLLYVTIDDLMPLIEKRIAREVKSCLDDYAVELTNIYHRYPWATQVSDTTAYPNRTGTYNVFFGRVSDIPGNATSSGGTPSPSDLALQQKIIDVQTALINYINNPTFSNLGTLRNKGDTLKDFAAASPYFQAPTDPARAAGNTADNCSGMSCTGTLTTQVQTALNAIPTGATNDNTMPSSWAGIPSCNKLILTSAYWPDWRDLVFYQVAAGYQPQTGASGTFTPLHISGSGNTNVDSGTYRATVIIAGKMLTGQSPRNQNNPPSTYLETSGSNSNAHQSVAGATPATDFITYKSSDTTNYSTVNDLVLCVDGKNNCP
ncbi:hypothetical protein [Sideroxydans lithotrophicus]|uniref:Uncharacterized protein n=1 Tax=Sideroxydans lithotrophicus (strain ES-1) TaxID=580332 RepID=D5CNK6_SIDLE|nr:hypothetical protein [Sideroxydans lithotrophicus]ADE10919.1 hypothetical protein Slit_0680 [Sideroxydans lithotrophicus ES-1]